MSEYCGEASSHTKQRGKIHWCEWCGQDIEIGERYASWLWFCDGERSTIYAHAECRKAWENVAHEEGGYAYADCDRERPEAKPLELEVER